MLRGLYTAALGMITQQTRTDVIANNLANANTNGYKRDELISSEFKSMLINRIDDSQKARNIFDLQHIDTARQYLLRDTIAEGGGTSYPIGKLGLGSQVAEIATNKAQGPLENTGNKLDLAITGDGYFSIQTPNGIRYTRDGNFYRSANGQLVTANNQAVLGENGRPITIPEDVVDLVIGTDGTITSNENNLGKIALSSFKDRNALLKEGNNLYRPQKGAKPEKATGSMQQGFLERSNINVASEMVNLIDNYRSYEADSKALTTQDTLLDKAVNDVGRVNG